MSFLTGKSETNIKTGEKFSKDQTKLLDAMSGYLRNQFGTYDTSPIQPEKKFADFLSDYENWAKNTPESIYGAGGRNATPDSGMYLSAMQPIIDYYKKNAGWMDPKDMGWWQDPTWLDLSGQKAKDLFYNSVLPTAEENLLPKVKESWGEDYGGSESAEAVGNWYENANRDMMKMVYDEIMNSQQLMNQYGIARGASLTDYIKTMGGSQDDLYKSLLASTWPTYANAAQKIPDTQMALLGSYPSMLERGATYGRDLYNREKGVRPGYDPYWSAASQIFNIQPHELLGTTEQSSGLLDYMLPFAMAEKITTPKDGTGGIFSNILGGITGLFGGGAPAAGASAGAEEIIASILPAIFAV